MGTIRAVIAIAVLALAYPILVAVAFVVVAVGTASFSDAVDAARTMERGIRQVMGELWRWRSEKS